MYGIGIPRRAVSAGFLPKLARLGDAERGDGVKAITTRDSTTRDSTHARG